MELSDIQNTATVLGFAKIQMKDMILGFALFSQIS